MEDNYRSGSLGSLRQQRVKAARYKRDSKAGGSPRDAAPPPAFSRPRLSSLGNASSLPCVLARRPGLFIAKIYGGWEDKKSQKKKRKRKKKENAGTHLPQIQQRLLIHSALFEINLGCIAHLLDDTIKYRALYHLV